MRDFDTVVAYLPISLYLHEQNNSNHLHQIHQSYWFETGNIESQLVTMPRAWHVIQAQFFRLHVAHSDILSRFETLDI